MFYLFFIFLLFNAFYSCLIIAHCIFVCCFTATFKIKKCRIYHTILYNICICGIMTIIYGIYSKLPILFYCSFSLCIWNKLSFCKCFFYQQRNLCISLCVYSPKYTFKHDVYNLQLYVCMCVYFYCKILKIKFFLFFCNFVELIKTIQHTHPHTHAKSYKMYTRTYLYTRTYESKCEIIIKVL